MNTVKWRARPPSGLYFVVLAVAMLISFYGASTTTWYYEIVFLMFPTWVVLGLYWLIRLSLAARSEWAAVRRHSLRWALAPLLFVSMVGALAVDGPLWVRFTLSEPSMQAYAKAIAAGVPPGPGCRMLGLYYVCHSERVEGGALLVVKDIGMMDRMGFAWLPGGRAPSDDGYDNDYTQFTGPWWGWEGWDGL
ncbi:hypothetical protein [Microbispora hainanensis]|uniref:Uncharacterized protein n=1 Tax=Microbispora hainanensis TaxID=568844 RepID=A0A544XV73_9ACTN|nr:hypothetical protein [Microbispora hainanensis]TQS08393.1 hypothetical protein FLX08_39040 [Microbispora hainanensis]